MAGVPRGVPGAELEARLLLVLGAAWLAPWTVLTAAAFVAGGHPRSSPLDFINPARIAARLRTGWLGHVWQLVDAASVDATRFWMALGALTLCFTVIAATLLSPSWRARLRLPRLTAPGARLPRHSHWAQSRDLRALSSRRAGPASFILGRHGRFRIATQPETSVLVIGPTRSGKTSALVVPNLLRWRGPAVVTSTKSELVELTAGYRQTAGPVYVYDPTGDSGARCPSVTWSPIAGCADLDRAWQVASWLCAGLQQSGSRGDNDWAHWAESGKLLIAPLLYVAAVTDRTIVDVRTWVHGFDLTTPLDLLEACMFDAGRGGTDDPERAVSMLTSVDQRPERERGTVFSTVMRIFNVFNERNVAASAMSSRFDADAFVRGDGTLYLCTPRQSPERIASLFVGILMSVVTAAYTRSEDGAPRRAERSLGLFLDELPNVVPVEELPAIASQGAGRGVLLMSIVQDLSQLRARYGPDRANSILNNHGCKVVLPGIADPDTGEVVSRLIGRGEFTDVQVSRTDEGRGTRAYSVQRDAIATPDALRRLHSGSAVVLHRGSPPALVQLLPWYGDPRCRRLTEQRYFRNAERVCRSAA